MKRVSYQTIISCLFLLGVFGQNNQQTDDKLQVFYDRLKRSDVKYCEDKTKMLPDCKLCIPGLRQSAGSNTCDSYVKESKEIRSEIGKLTSDRYGAAVLKSSRPFGLYPCKSHCFISSPHLVFKDAQRHRRYLSQASIYINV